MENNSLIKNWTKKLQDNIHRGTGFCNYTKVSYLWQIYIYIYNDVYLIKHSLNLPCVYVVYLNASYSVITQFHLDVIGYEALSAQQELSSFLRTKKNYTQEVPFKCHFIIISSWCTCILSAAKSDHLSNKSHPKQPQIYSPSQAN